MNKRITWNLQVSKHLNEKLENYIKADSFTTKSEFIRVAVRDRLKVEEKIFREEQEREKKT